MKCPRCGHEMTLDTHRKYALNMCYECGYIEGRLIDPEKKGESNFERMKKLNFNEMVAFLTKGLNLDEAKLADWLDDEVTRTTAFCTPYPIAGAACFCAGRMRQIAENFLDTL